MSVSLLIASALLARAEAPAITVQAGVEYVDVAYEELMQGRLDEAISRIRANSSLEADDPAALINLGTAYALKGHPKKAKDYYLGAIASGDRYDLELADGRWMDSRRAARLAVEMLSRGETLALR